MSTPPSSTEPAEKAELYFISSKDGTDPAVFDAYIKSIAQDYEERVSRFADVSWQSQLVNLTAEKAKEAKKQPFILIVRKAGRLRGVDTEGLETGSWMEKEG